MVLPQDPSTDVAWRCLQLTRKDFELLVGSVMGPLGEVSLFLAQVPLLRDLEPAKRLQLAKAMRKRDYRDGERIITHGEQPSDSRTRCMYVVERGEALVSSLGGQELARKKRGEFFGEMALLNDQA